MCLLASCAHRWRRYLCRPRLGIGCRPVFPARLGLRIFRINGVLNAQNITFRGTCAADLRGTTWPLIVRGACDRAQAGDIDDHAGSVQRLEANLAERGIPRLDSAADRMVPRVRRPASLAILPSVALWIPADLACCDKQPLWRRI